MNPDQPPRAPQPPQDLEAEQSVLGGMLLSPHAIEDVTAILGDDGGEFYKPAHQTIYQIILDLHRRGEPVDRLTFSAELERRGELMRVGGGSYVHTLIATVPTATNAGYYADRVAKKAALRRLREEASRILGMVDTVEQGGGDVDEIVARSRAGIDDATASYRNRGHQEGAWIGELVDEALERYAQPRPQALPTGWLDVDDVLNGGLRPGQLMVVGARPGVGKSVVGINLAVQASRAGSGVVFASLEMAREEITDRVLAQVAQVELSRLTSHTLDDQDWRRVKEAREALRGTPLRIEDSSSLSLSRLRSLARDQTRHAAGLGLVVADYLQLLNGGDPRQPRHEQVAGFSRELKLMAKEFRVPVVALSQLNRNVEARLDKRPMVGDLRESGAVEQDADIIALLWANPDEAKDGTITMIIGKHRQGRCGDVELGFAPHYAQARNLRLA